MNLYILTVTTENIVMAKNKKEAISFWRDTLEAASKDYSEEWLDIKIKKMKEIPCGWDDYSLVFSRTETLLSEAKELCNWQPKENEE